MDGEPFTWSVMRGFAKLFADPVAGLLLRGLVWLGRRYAAL